MSIPSVSTWDVVSPDTVRRATQSDLITALKVDDVYAPPNIVEDPCAIEYNQFALQLASLNKTVPALVVSVTFTGGTPSVEYFSSPSGILVVGDLTVTDNGTGDTTVAWPSGKLPAPITHPLVSANHTGACGVTAYAPTATSVRVITVATPSGGANSAADAPFTVVVF
jgi:hypothetical protein